MHKYVQRQLSHLLSLKQMLAVPLHNFSSITQIREKTVQDKHIDRIFIFMAFLQVSADCKCVVTPADPYTVCVKNSLKKDREVEMGGCETGALP